MVKSLRGVFEDLEMNDNPAQSLQQLIHNPADDYYLFKADTIPEQDSLTFYIRKEFGDFDVLTDVKLGAYSAVQKKYVYEDYIPTAASGFQHYYGQRVCRSLRRNMIIYCFIFRTVLSISSER